MISNKTAAVLFLIALSMKTAASTFPNDILGGQIHMMNLLLKKQEHASAAEKDVLINTDNTANGVEVQGKNTESPDDTQVPVSSNKPTLIKRQRHKSCANSTTSVLKDTTSAVEAVQPKQENTREISISQGQLLPQANKFEELIEQGEYAEIFKLAKSTEMDEYEFLKQLCPLVKTSEQYNGIVDHLKQYKFVAPYYLHGDLTIVREVILANSGAYKGHTYYVTGGDLERVLHLAFRDNHHDRIIDLFNIRNEISVEKEKTFRYKGTDFKRFVQAFLEELCRDESYNSLKRFLTFRKDELNEKHPELLATICQRLTRNLRDLLGNSVITQKFLIDWVGQPSLLTPLPFAEGFLQVTEDPYRSHFVIYGWREAIREGLREGCMGGGEELWTVMRNMYPGQLPEEFPDTEEELADVLSDFTTKKQKEEQWIRMKAFTLFGKLDELAALNILPKDVWNIFIEYVKPTWLDD